MSDDGSDRELTLMLPGVLSAGEPRQGSFTGTKGLLLAVLEDGIRGYLSAVEDVRAEAEYWIGSTRHRSPFSFVVICETLGLEPGAVRRALARMRAEHVNPTAAIRRTRPNVRRAHRISQRRAG